MKKQIQVHSKNRHGSIYAPSGRFFKTSKKSPPRGDGSRNELTHGSRNELYLDLSHVFAFFTPLSISKSLIFGSIGSAVKNCKRDEIFSFKSAGDVRRVILTSIMPARFSIPSVRGVSCGALGIFRDTNIARVSSNTHYVNYKPAQVVCFKGLNFYEILSRFMDRSSRNSGIFPPVFGPKWDTGCQIWPGFAPNWDTCFSVMRSIPGNHSGHARSDPANDSTHGHGTRHGTTPNTRRPVNQRMTWGIAWTQVQTSLKTRYRAPLSFQLIKGA